MLPYVSIALPSGPEESGQLLGTTDPGDAIRFFLDRGVEMVAIKLGPQGCMVASQSAPDPLTIPTPTVDPIDTTGAGDAFNGGLLHGLLTGMTLPQAAVLGVVTAALKVRGRAAPSPACRGVKKPTRYGSSTGGCWRLKGPSTRGFRSGPAARACGRRRGPSPQ